MAHDSAIRVDFRSRWGARAGWRRRSSAKIDGLSGGRDASASAIATSSRMPAILRRRTWWMSATSVSE
jgi:hypothetical protein